MNNLGSAILYSANYIERHLHHKARTFGKSADQSGTNWATEDRLVSFQAISGNNAYGSDANDEAKVFGSTDTPFISGQAKFDSGSLLVTGVSDDDEYIIRIIWGTGTIEDAIIAGQYSTTPFKHDSTAPTIDTAHTIINIGTEKLIVGTKVWVQIKSNTDNATINFYIVSHGYLY